MPDHPAAPVAGDQRPRRRPRPRIGSGLAWLVAERNPPGFGCYWYGGRSDGILWEHSREDSVAAAVSWGQARTGRVRLRAADGRTTWEGTAERPEGILPGRSTA